MSDGELQLLMGPAISVKIVNKDVTVSREWEHSTETTGNGSLLALDSTDQEAILNFALSSLLTR